MAIIMALVSLLLVVAAYAGFTKLGARLYRRTKLSWMSAIAFGAIATTLGVMGTLANQALGGVLPVLVFTVFFLASQIALGAWFLGSRAANEAGQLVGLKGGAVLSAIAVATAFGIGLLLAFLLPAIAPK